jgi:dUTP pyrophosphatase
MFIINGISANFGTIDSDYRGEILVLLINFSKNNFIIQRGMRIAQIVFQKIEKINLELSDDLDKTTRGKKGFGSTGIKEDKH